jgi:hypothetical protein
MTGFIKRGVPIIPSEIDPPRKGTLIIRDLLILSSIKRVLLKSITTKTAKNFHSFFEKELKTEFI